MPEYRASYRRDARKRKIRTGMQVTNRGVFMLARLSRIRANASRTGPSGQPLDSHEIMEVGSQIGEPDSTKGR